MEGNRLAWHVWSILNSKDRPFSEVGVGPIPSMAMLALCEVYDATVDEFEKVLVLENLLYKGPSGGNKEEGEQEADPEKVIKKNKKVTAKRKK